MVLQLILFLNFIIYIHCQTTNIPYVATCPQTQYLSSTDIVCVSCSVNATQSSNGLSCVCKAGYYYTKNGGGSQVLCQQCPNTQSVSSDGWTCVNTVTISCLSNQTANGIDILGNQKSISCQPCAPRYTPLNNQCQLCVNILNSINSPNICDCSPGVSTGSSCLLSTPSNDSTLYYSSTSVKSGYLVANMLDQYALCKNNIDSACQSMASMCVMAVYNLNDYTTKNGKSCGLFGMLESTPYTKKPGFPMLYYPTSQTLETSIDHQYTRGEVLQIILAAYDISGQFLGYRNATQNGNLQLCASSAAIKNETFRFGTHYTETCNISVSQLLNQSAYSPTFYDPYLSYKDSSGTQQLYPIPIKISSIATTSGILPNSLYTPSNFILTRRLLMVDNFGSITPPFQTNRTAPYLTIASKMRLVVVKPYSTNFDITTDGKIFLPYLEVNLTTVTATSASSTSITFEVVYYNQATYTSAFQYSISVAMGVLCALGGLYSILRSFFWCRRSGIASFEGLVLLKVLAHGCASISNVFFLVIFGVSLYFLLLYKNQTYFSIIPPDDDTFFVAYLICAFLLKLLEIIHIFVTQCTVDIFLIDWERPKHLLAPKPVIERSKFDHADNAGDQNTALKDKIQPNSGVSIWRSYFIANEWNEIQTYRKTSLIFNLVVVLLFMEVIGFGNITRFDAFVNYTTTSTIYQAPYYRMFRFAIIVSIFAITGFIQWLYTVLIYERVVEDKLRNYVDLCSVSNVSVFILAHRQFGYYIHGRSVHGSADVSLAEMYISLQKENSGSCAKRGLESDSMQQTYIMALPNTFSKGLDYVYQPSGMRMSEDNRTMQYLEVNKFLDKFINRTIINPQIKFQFQDRKFFEDIFDGEFDDNSNDGRFYRDNGVSFGNVLFYGQELALITFDILLFCVVDLILQNTVFDAFITWGFVTFLKMIRNGCGSHNLAKKTLVDRRFLI